MSQPVSCPACGQPLDVTLAVPAPPPDAPVPQPGGPLPKADPAADLGGQVLIERDGQWQPATASG